MERSASTTAWASSSRSTRSSRRAASPGRCAAGRAVDPGDEPRPRPDPRAPRRPDPRALGPRHVAHAARRGAEGAGAQRRHRGAPTLEPERPFVASELARTFVVHATDYVLTVLGAAVDRILREEAPKVCVRFVPNTPDDAALLRDAGLGSGRGHLRRPAAGDAQPPAAHRSLRLRRAPRSPRAKKRFTLEQFVGLPHIQVAPRGKPGGYIDDVLRERGLSRTVARAVPYFLTALQLAAQTDYVLTISERMASASPSRFRSGPGGAAEAAALRAEPACGTRASTPTRPIAFLREVFVRAATRGRRRASRGAAHPPRHLGPDLWPDAQAAQAQVA
jgi:hypothetical protein